MNISELIEHAVSAYFSQWLGQHPYLAWSIAHPIPSLVLLLLAIFSLWGLIKAIGRGIEQIWIFLLKTPFKLLQPIFRVIWRSIRQGFGHTNSRAAQLTTKSARSLNSERIETIVRRLQTLSQEQDLLLQELSTLANLAPNQSETALIPDPQSPDLSANLPKLDQRQH
jgi:hypothetical protein